MTSLRVLLLYSLPLLVVAYFVQQARGTKSSRPTRCVAKNATHLWESSQLPTPSPSVRSIHLIVLVHGWMGNPQEQDYLKESLQRFAPYDSATDQFLVHAAVCNDGHTNDGIAKGGARLAQEINTLVQHIWDRTPAIVTLSLVGNSLGGLYARYALPSIQWKTNDNRNLIPKLFVTTCTPHLGVNQQTYIRLPRSLEYPIARVLQTMGQDLFQFSSTISDLTLDPTFVRPLAAFSHRMAYANAYATDFQVGTATAAFWEATTESVHVLVPFEEMGSVVVPSTLVLQLKTRKVTSSSNSNSTSTNSSIPLSQALDTLGWTKVLMDVRELLWSTTTTTASQARVNTTTTWATNTTTASELLQRYAHVGRFQSLPLGHTVSVANAKNAWYRRINQGGQPIMDYLARDMLRKLLEA